MRFKMPFENEDSSWISWFLGTITSVQFADPLGWPTSPWRLLQVTWDEQDLLQNVRKVSPWLVELISGMPAIHLSPISPPRKRLRLPEHPDFTLDGHIPPPTFSGNLLVSNNNLFRYAPENSPAGMQGARHSHYGLSLPDFHLNRPQSGLLPFHVPPPDYAATPMRQISLSNSEDTLSPDRNGSSLDHHGRQEHSSCERFPWGKDNRQETEASLEIGHCKVFMESEDVGRTMDLSLL
ncbi:unnamed protein product [Lupinus luteus]|uniref:Auxin response factor domain-containing protein n=1 Tax=Lupinus luteus TaxID=3873 RepID=A0AAV1VRD3_LUPLU